MLHQVRARGKEIKNGYGEHMVWRLVWDNKDGEVSVISMQVEC